MKNKKLYILLATILTASFIVTGCGKKADLKDGAQVAVSIEGAKITATEYYEEIKNDNIAKLIDMVDHSILDKKYKANEEEDSAVKSQIDQIKSNYGEDENTYNAILKQYFGVENEKEFEEMLRLEYKRNLAVNDYISNNLTDKEINKYYEDNIVGDIKASHILITADYDDDATEEEKKEAENVALEEAKKIIKKLNDGEDFAKLAKKYSKDTATSADGGNLDYFDPNDMVVEFATAVKDLENGKYTKEPIKTQYGYHIILKVDQKEKAKLEDVKDEIKETLTNKKLEESTTIYYETLIKVREEQKINWKDDSLKKAYNEYMEKLIENAKNSAQ